MIGKLPTVWHRTDCWCIMGEVNDKIQSFLSPIMGGIDWLTGVGGIGSLLSSVSSYVDMLLSFLACDSLQWGIRRLSSRRRRI